MLDLEKKPEKPAVKISLLRSDNDPKDMYGTASEVKVVGTPNIIIVHSKLSDDLVYKLTKAFFEPAGLEMIRNSHPSAKALTLEKAAVLPYRFIPAPRGSTGRRGF